MKTTRRPTERSGLHLRPQMDQIVNYLTYCQEKVRFPDRTARLVRNHPFMTQLDFFDMQEAQEIQWEEQQQRHAALNAARQMGLGVAEAEAQTQHRDQDDNADYWRKWWGYDEEDDDDVTNDYNDETEDQADDQERNRQNIVQQAQQELGQNPGTIPAMQVPAARARERMQRSRSPYTQRKVKPEPTKVEPVAPPPPRERMQRSRSPYRQPKVKPEPMKVEPVSPQPRGRDPRSRSPRIKQKGKPEPMQVDPNAPIPPVAKRERMQRSRSPYRQPKVKPEPMKSIKNEPTIKNEPKGASAEKKRVLGTGSAASTKAPRLQYNGGPVPPSLPRPPPRPPPTVSKPASRESFLALARAIGQPAANDAVAGRAGRPAAPANAAVAARAGGTAGVVRIATPVDKGRKNKKQRTDSVQIAGVNINKNKDMKFWEEASAREMRAQLNLRNRAGIGNWAFKDRQQLLDIIRSMIKKGEW